MKVLLSLFLIGIVAANENYRPTNNYGSVGYDPYDSFPGAYNKEAYGGPMAYGKGAYNLNSISQTYLNSDYYNRYNKYCNRGYGQQHKITQGDITQAVEYAKNMIKQAGDYQSNIYKNGGYHNASYHSYFGRNQLRAYFGDQKEQIRREHEALFMELITRYLTQYKCLSKHDVSTFLPQVKLYNVINPYGKGYCNKYNKKEKYEEECDKNAKYRTMDGECNNLKHRYWGKSFTCHLRFLPADYDDGVSIPRARSATGAPLPNPRTVSKVIHYQTRQRSYYTSGFMSMGQYFTHDFSLTSQWRSEYTGMLKCCPKPSHHQCFPIQIPRNDHHYGKYRQTCLEFVRSVPCPLCNAGQREQQNDQTSYLDVSQVYGATNTEAKKVRAYRYGLLKTSKDIYGRDILPETTSPWDDQCSSPNKNVLCYFGGDNRINQNPHLLTWHLIGLRLHNYHARSLLRLNPQWGDEKIYQEARRLTIAQHQIIFYKEYMPILLGPTLMDYYGLRVDHPGYSYYEPETDATTWNEAMTTAGRHGHSTISNHFSLIGYKNYGARLSSSAGNYSAHMKGYYLKDNWFNPTFMKDGWQDPNVVGFWTDKAMRDDPSLTEVVQDYLFKLPYQPFGADLAAYNVQRGRDHGIPPYHAMLNFCFNIKVYSWYDLEKFIPSLELQYLKKVYMDYRDIDLWTAGLLERKLPDANVGPTFGCLLGVQYYHMKFGDRFFVTHAYQKGSFTPAQLDNIRNATSVAAMYCATSDNIQYVPANPFIPVSNVNPLLPCRSWPKINYHLFSEKPYY